MILYGEVNERVTTECVPQQYQQPSRESQSSSSLFPQIIFLPLLRHALGSIFAQPIQPWKINKNLDAHVVWEKSKGSYSNDQSLTILHASALQVVSRKGCQLRKWTHKSSGNVSPVTANCRFDSKARITNQSQQVNQRRDLEKVAWGQWEE